MARKAGTQVVPGQYFDAAMDLLERLGPAELKIGTLCAELGVTSGSFYHHFGGWSGFVEALMAHWEAEQTARIVELTQTATADPVERLDILKQLAVTLPHAAEAAIRAWASLDADVATALRRIDDRRLAALQNVLAGAVPDRATAARLASFGQSMLVGFQQIHHPPDPVLLRAMLDDYHALVLRHVRPQNRGHSTVFEP